jgi:hypothetical protein
LDDRLFIFWNAFWDLHGSRQSGFNGPEAIQMADIAAYAAICGFSDPSFRHELMFMAQQMDDEWLTIQTEKRPKT